MHDTAQEKPPPLTATQAGYIDDLMARYGGDPVIRIITTKFRTLFAACRHAGMEDDDVRQAGMVGLVRAARMYDPAYRTRFGKKPPLFVTFAAHWMRYEIQRWLRQHRGVPATVSPQPHLSLSELVDELIPARDDGHDDGHDDGMERNHQARRAVARFLLALPERQKSVLIMRYGLFGGRQMKHREIGAWFGQSKQRSQQVAENAMARLRRMVRAAGRPAD